MHPKEAYKQKTGTGRLAHLTLTDSEIIIGVDFSQNSRLNELLNNPEYFPVVMYPGEDAWTATGWRDSSPHTLKEAINNKKLLVVLVDATWPCAHKMLRLSPNVTELQKISFRAGYRSEYKFKKEPAEDYLSTIETCYYLIKELKEAGFVVDDPEPLLNIFRRMVNTQIDCLAKRIESGEPDRYSLPNTIRAKKALLRDKNLTKQEYETQI